MLVLLAVPVIVAVAVVHRIIHVVAPTNMLVRRVRSTPPRWRTPVVLLMLATLLLIAMHVVARAVEGGAPGWLNLVALVLAWDAIKVGCLAVGVLLWKLRILAGKTLAGRSRIPQTAS